MSTPLTATAPSPPVARTHAARWALLLLTSIATVQFFDRALMVVILEPIKREFALSDAQLGDVDERGHTAADPATLVQQRRCVLVDTSSRAVGMGGLELDRARPQAPPEPRQLRLGQCLERQRQPGQRLAQVLRDLATRLVATTTVSGEGFDQGVSLLAAFLTEEHEAAFTRTLHAGVPYTFVAGGESAGADTDVDLLIRDASGAEVAAALEEDAAPRLPPLGQRPRGQALLLRQRPQRRPQPQVGQRDLVQALDAQGLADDVGAAEAARHAQVLLGLPLPQREALPRPAQEDVLPGLALRPRRDVLREGALLVEGGQPQPNSQHRAAIGQGALELLAQRLLALDRVNLDGRRL